MRSTPTAPCLFCQIAAGEIRSHVVYENERLLAFLDINPIRPGHTQVVPKEHFAYFDDLPHELLSEIAGVAQSLARALKGFIASGGLASRSLEAMCLMPMPT